MLHIYKADAAAQARGRRSAWRPKLTQALQRQSAVVGSWHITLPPLFLIQVIFLFFLLTIVLPPLFLIL
jgi:hypothetical protein